MSDEEKIVVEPVEVPGMQFTFQSPVGPLGKGVSFVGSADAEITFDDLRKRLDIIAATARYLDAFEQLRIDQQALINHRKILAKDRAALVGVQQTIDGKLNVVGGARRRVPDATKVAPHDVNTAQQFEKRILDREEQIAECETRIPFWKAILRGEEPLDIVANPRMAAE